MQEQKSPIKFYQVNCGGTRGVLSCATFSNEEEARRYLDAFGGPCEENEPDSCMHRSVKCTIVSILPIQIAQGLCCFNVKIQRDSGHIEKVYFHSLIHPSYLPEDTTPETIHWQEYEHIPVWSFFKVWARDAKHAEEKATAIFNRWKQLKSIECVDRGTQ
jgi:hypothetical protein